MTDQNNSKHTNETVRKLLFQVPAYDHQEFKGWKWSFHTALDREVRDFLKVLPPQWEERSEFQEMKISRKKLQYLRRTEQRFSCCPFQSFYYKGYRLKKGWLERLKRWVRPSPLEQEKERIQSVFDRGVETVPFLALARDPEAQPGEVGSFGILPFLDQAVPMDQFLQETQLNERERFGNRAEIIAEYGAYAGSLHRKGIDQDDFDPNNLLLLPEGGERRFLLIDMERIQMKSSLTTARKSRVLAKTSRFPYEVSRMNCLRYLRGYHRTADTGISLRRFTDQITEERKRIDRRDLKKAYQSCFSSNRNYVVRRTGTRRGVIRQSWPMVPGVYQQENQLVKLLKDLSQEDTKRLASRAEKVDSFLQDVGFRLARERRGTTRMEALWGFFNARFRVHFPAAIPLACVREQGKPLTVFFGLPEADYKDEDLGPERMEKKRGDKRRLIRKGYWLGRWIHLRFQEEQLGIPDFERRGRQISLKIFSDPEAHQVWPMDFRRLNAPKRVSPETLFQRESFRERAMSLYKGEKKSPDVRAYVDAISRASFIPLQRGREWFGLDEHHDHSTTVS